MAEVITKVCNILASESNLFAAAITKPGCFVYGGFFRMLAKNIHALAGVNTIDAVRRSIGAAITDIDIIITNNDSYREILDIINGSGRMPGCPKNDIKVVDTYARILKPYGHCSYSRATETMSSGRFTIPFDVSYTECYRDKYDYLVNTLAYNKSIGVHSTLAYNGSWKIPHINDIIRMCRDSILVPLFKFDPLDSQCFDLHAVRYKKMRELGFIFSIPDAFDYSTESGCTALSIIAMEIQCHLSQPQALDFC